MGRIVRIHTFDVFDTVLTRDVGDPTHIFYKTALQAIERFGLNLTPGIYSRIRSDAEKELYEENRQPNIYDIYSNFCEIAGFEDELSKELAELEINLELKSVIPVPKIVEQIRQIKKEGRRIIYISDMYLPSEVIFKMLDKFGLIHIEDSLYVSCEWGATKQTGKLFDIVAEKENIQKKDLLHVGNSRKSDIEGAGKAGVDALFFGEANLNRFEKLLCEYSSHSDENRESLLQYSSIAAALRLSRLKTHAIKESALKDVATSVAAPVLYNFVVNLLKSGSGRPFFFLARDGYILCKIAGIINKTWNLDEDLHYICISRDVMLLALADKLSSDLIQKQLHKIFQLDTLSEVLERLGVEKPLAQKAGISIELMSVKVRDLESSNFEKIIKTDLFEKQIKIRANKNRKKLIEYLKQESFYSYSEINIVDVGWNLLTQDLFAELNEPYSEINIHGYYFGIEYASSHKRFGFKKGYMWDRRNGSINLPQTGLKQLIEVFCTAPHGKTIGYEVNDDEMLAPIFTEYENEKLKEWGADDLIFFIEAAVKEVTVAVGLDEKADDKTMMRSLLDQFWENPLPEEVRRWGSYPYHVSSDGKSVVQLHNQQNISRLLYYAIRTGKMPYSHFDIWSSAHMKQYSGIKSAILKSGMALNGVAKEVRDLLKSR